MVDKNISKPGPKTPNSREERLKAALKANMGRRKAQTRSRSAAVGQDTDSKQAKDDS